VHFRLEAGQKLYAVIPFNGLAHAEDL
jgi:hypothetical protein